MENGIIRRVIGPVVDVQFPSGKIPDIYNAIEVKLKDRKIVMEVVQHIGDNSVRCVSLFSTDGLSRGCAAVDTGAPIKMPVGEATLGRMFNVVGEPIDGKGAVNTDKRLPIHRDAPAFTDIRPGFVKTALLNDGLRYPMCLSPRYAARLIVRAIDHRQRRAIIDWRYALLVFFWRLLPEWLWERLPIAN